MKLRDYNREFSTAKTYARNKTHTIQRIFGRMVLFGYEHNHIDLSNLEDVYGEVLIVNFKGDLPNLKEIHREAHFINWTGSAPNLKMVNNRNFNSNKNL